MPEAGGRGLAATLVILFVAAFLLVLFGRIAEPVLLVFLSSLFASYLCAVTGTTMVKLHLPRSLALPLAVVFSLLVSAGVGILILPPAFEQGRELFAELPGYAQRFDSLLTQLAQRYPILEQAIPRRSEVGFVDSMIADATGFLRASFVPYLTAGGRLAVEIVSVFAMAIYLARDPVSYREGFIALLPPKFRSMARAIIADLGNTVRAWIWAQLLSMLVLGALTALGLWALGVPHALAFGLFSGVAAIVPFFGTLLSTLMPALLMLVIAGWPSATAVMVLGAGVHLLEANVVAPMIFQERLNLPPVLTIMSVLIMARFLGVLGLVVAVPLLAVTVVVVRHILICQIYKDYDVECLPSAVLVGQTGERRAVSVAP
ncbi:MAG: AI-2E family transporter [Gemmatimonadales bacterium]